MTVRCRIAPSPTGPLHIGTARTALYNFLFARHEGGTFVLRLEDTDVERSTVAHERDILEGLHWLGLHWDEGPEVAAQAARGPYAPYRQMERLALYRAAADRLLDRDLAYRCYCTREELDADRAAQEAAHRPPGYVGRCAHLAPEQRRSFEAEGRRPLIRFRVPSGTVAFDDLVRGHVEIDADTLGGDLAIVRSDGTPLYHFSVVVDDAEMAITHVIRGEDHLSNTPKHILLFRALDAEVPAFAHLPLILNPDRTKMSKRKSQTAVEDYRAQGFVPEAMVNYLALLGWASGTEEELFSMDELVERFELSRVHSAGAIFDRERLEWLNGQWLRRLAQDDLAERLAPFLATHLATRRSGGAQVVRQPVMEEIAPIVPLVQERLPRLDAIGDLVDFLYLDPITIDPAQLVPRRWDVGTTVEGLAAARSVIDAQGRVSFEADELEGPLRALAASRGWKAGDLFMALRAAVTGRTISPPLFDSMVALGPGRTLERLDAAIAALRSRFAPG